MKKCLIVVVYWGRWHADLFLDVMLPSLLMDGNLPAFASEVATTFLIYTSPHHRDELIRSPLFSELSRLAQVEFHTDPQIGAGDKFATHHRAWAQATALARGQAAWVGFFPPDICWCDGSLAQIARLIGAGPPSIYLSGIRVAAETFVPEVMADYFPKAGPHRRLSPAELVRLSVRHSHPFNYAVYHTSPNSPFVADMELWPVGGDGWVCHCYLAGPVFLVEPAHVEMDSKQLVTGYAVAPPVSVVFDSHQVNFVSITPTMLYSGWYLNAGPEGDLDKAFKAVRVYSSPLNPFVGENLFQFYQTKADGAAWRRELRAARVAAGRMRVKEGYLRAYYALVAYGLSEAAALLALCLQRVRRLPGTRQQGRRGLFVPCDGQRRERLADTLFGGLAEREIGRYLASHVTAAPMPPRPSASHTAFSLETIAGSRLRVEVDGADKIYVDGIPVERVVSSDEMIIFVLGGLLRKPST